MAFLVESFLTWTHKVRNPEPSRKNSVPERLQGGAIKRQRPAHQHVQNNSQALKKSIVYLFHRRCRILGDHEYLMSERPKKSRWNKNDSPKYQFQALCTFCPRTPRARRREVSRTTWPAALSERSSCWSRSRQFWCSCLRRATNFPPETNNTLGSKNWILKTSLFKKKYPICSSNLGWTWHYYLW